MPAMEVGSSVKRGVLTSTMGGARYRESTLWSITVSFTSASMYAFTPPSALGTVQSTV